MEATFNMGLGMILVVDKTDADPVMRMLKRVGERSFVVGEIRRGAKGVTIRS
jgi:phosphoribosylformylglycinamidine cyclo-ligase